MEGNLQFHQQHPLSLDRSPPTMSFDPLSSPESNPSKRRKLDAPPHGSLPSSSSSSIKDKVPWRSDSQRRIYSLKLVEALFRARNRPAPVSSGGDVRGIADRVLATAAKGRTRWSRAILASRRVRVTALGKRRRLRRATAGKRPPLVMVPAVERRVKALGRLVPGCKGVSVTRLLEEATDYIAALEMQVKAMVALSQLLAQGQGTSPPLR